MSYKSKVLSFSLTEGIIELLRACSLADERSMSAQVRHLIRKRAYEIVDSPSVPEGRKAKIRELMSSEEFSVADTDALELIA